MSKKICVVCGKEIKEGDLYSGGPDGYKCSDTCATKHFWNDALNNGIIINGKCFKDGGYVEKPTPGESLGHAGRLFTIEMNDGSIIKTNNLWFKGVIPDEFKVPDNAKFI